MMKASSDPAAPRSCANCGKPEGTTVDGSATITVILKDCSRCKLVGYCGKACQTQHWKTGGHKEFCLSPEQRRPADSKKAAASPYTPECLNCGIREGVDGTHLKFCRRCQAVQYCGRECQMQHWKSGGHNEFCLTPDERRPEAVAAEEGQPLPQSGPGKSTAQKESQCSICFDPLGTLHVPTTLLACAHEFHVACVERLRKFGASKV